MQNSRKKSQNRYKYKKLKRCILDSFKPDFSETVKDTKFFVNNSMNNVFIYIQRDPARSQNQDNKKKHKDLFLTCYNFKARFLRKG